MRDSKSLFEAACRRIPGGVNSPVRAFRGVGGDPFFVAHGKGARIWDVEGRSYLDFLGSWGPLILGHAAPTVVAAVTEAAARGTSYGAPTALEVEMAEAITAAYPSIELVRLVSSGSDRARAAAEVRRLLSRSLRQPPGEGGLGRRDVLHPRQRRRTGPAGPAHADGGLQRPRRRAGYLPR